MTILANLVEAIACLLYFSLSILCLETFFPRSHKYRFSILTIAFAIYFPLTLVGMSFIPNLIGSILSLLILFIISIVCYSGRWTHKLLIIVMYNIFDIIASNIFFYLGTLFSNQDYSELLLPGSITRIYTIVLIYLFEATVICIIRQLTNHFSHFSEESLAVISLFLMCSFLIVLMNYYLLFALSQGDWKLEIIGLASTCVMLIVIISTLCIFRRLQEKNRLLLQYESEALRMKQLQENEQRVHEIRHDMKHYFLTYQMLLQDGKISEVMDDMQKMVDVRLNEDSFLLCKNQLINSMLTQKKLLCDEKDIPFSVRADFSYTDDDIELTVILSNLLDNAIEAEEKIAKNNRFIYIEIISRPNAISILIENAITESVLSVNSNLHTSKDKPSSHGIGIKSVKRLLNRRNGIIDIYEDHQKFCVHIYIPINQ